MSGPPGPPGPPGPMRSTLTLSSLAPGGGDGTQALVDGRFQKGPGVGTAAAGLFCRNRKNIQ